MFSNSSSTEVHVSQSSLSKKINVPVKSIGCDIHLEVAKFIKQDMFATCCEVATSFAFIGRSAYANISKQILWVSACTANILLLLKHNLNCFLKTNNFKMNQISNKI